MSLEDCAETLRARDPERFAMCLLADAAARPRLLTLYALNLELARAPLASDEPLIAEMRLQWWIERLEEIGAGAVPSHELLGPLAEAWGARAAGFVALAEPRRRDAAREPHDGADAVVTYVRETAVPLALFAAEALASGSGIATGGFAPPDPRGIFGQERSTEAAYVIAQQAEGLGLAAWLAALPALQGLGLGLRDPSPQVLADLAGRARGRLGEARAGRRAVPRRLAPALFPGPGVDPVLRAAPKGIKALAALPVPSEFRRRLALGAFSLTHRWWL